MSFIDDIIDTSSNLLSGVGDFLSSGSVVSNIAKTALMGYTVNKINKSIQKDNTKSDTAVVNPTKPDPGVRLQVNPDPEHKIPVVYGSAYLGGIITDAALSTDHKTMYYCITICEQTGPVGLGAGADSVITFNDIYWNDQRLIFQGDGQTVSYSIDREGNIDRSLNGLVKVFPFSGNSSTPVNVEHYSAPSLLGAASRMLNWDSTKQMNDLVFAIVQITYSKEKNLTSLGNIKFHLTNSLTQPGDCLYDYLTNTRYGAGIDATEIYSQ